MYIILLASTSRRKYAYLSQGFQVTDFSPTLMAGLPAPSCTSQPITLISKLITYTVSGLELIMESVFSSLTDF